MLGGLPRTAVFYSKEFPHLFSSYIRSRVQSQAKPVLGKTIISGKTSFVLQQYEANDVKLCTIQWWRWHRLCFWSSFLPVFFTPQRPAPIGMTVREAGFAVATTYVEKAAFTRAFTAGKDLLFTSSSFLRTTGQGTRLEAILLTKTQAVAVNVRCTWRFYAVLDSMDTSALSLHAYSRISNMTPLFPSHFFFVTLYPLIIILAGKKLVQDNLGLFTI